MNIISATRLALLSAAVIGPMAAWGNSYRFVDLGENVRPTGIDAKDQVSATQVHYRSPTRERALVYSGGKWRHELPFHTDSIAAGISKGRVAGDLSGHAVVWVGHGQPIAVVPPGTGSNSAGLSGINASGQAGGRYSDSNGTQRCFTWSFDTQTSQDLDVPLHQQCTTTAIDDQGRIYGSADSGSPGVSLPFVWHRGRTQQLAMLKGALIGQANSGNKAGDIVGTMTVPDGEGEYYDGAVLWHDGAPSMLPCSIALSSSYASAINDAGTIVGSSQDLSREDFYAVRFASDNCVNLNDEVVNHADKAGFILSGASAISPDGVIVGVATTFAGKSHGFMLIPQ